VLGACLCDPQCYWKIADLLTADDFNVQEHAGLFEMIADRARGGKAFDAVTIFEANEHIGNLAIDLAGAEGWRTSNVRAYAEIVSAAAVARRVKRAGMQIAKLDNEGILGAAQQLIGACAPQQTGSVKHIKEFLRQSIADMQRKVDEPDALIGIPTGIPELDELTCGWQAGDLIIIAARPSVGKTALAVQCAIAAAKAGNPTFFASLEMSGVQLSDRVQAHMAHVHASGLRNPKLLDESDFVRLFDAAATIMELPLYIDETSGITVDSFCARARQMNAVKKLGLIVVDYLTQFKPPKANSTADAIQEITRTLKALAKELKTPLILLSQLNRDGEGRRPTMATLRDSGAIEQDADIIIFLHRPDPENRDHVQLIVEKQRNGEVRDFDMHADMAHMKFTVADYSLSPVEQRAANKWSKMKAPL
jgi:replicative DNA helicase